MKIKIYVDWENREVYDEKKKQEEIKEIAEAYEKDTYEFNDFLENDESTDVSYPYAELFNLSEAAREEITKRYKECCHIWAEENFNDRITEIEFEV